jgi:two-component system LytT family response regulator
MPPEPAPAPHAPAPGSPDVVALRVLIVDDDAAARGRAREVLGAQPGVTVTGECGDGESAVALIRAGRPDVVLLDVQMPGLDGFGVVERVGAAAMPPVVFTSAYAEFAVRAFEAYALDYVLKPFDDARLVQALERVRREVAARRPPAPAAGGAAGAPAGALAGTVAADPRLHALLELLSRPARPRYPDALAIRAGAQYAVVRAADVDWIEADGNYARVYVQKKARIVSKSLAVLEREVLDPARFVRVHRSTIVNVARVAAVEPGPHGDVDLVLHDGTRVACSRRYRDRLEERLYFTT